MQSTHKTQRTVLSIFTVACVLGFVFIVLHPLSNTALKLGLLACIIGVWLGLLLLTWQRKPMRITLLLIPALLAIPFLLPSAPLNTQTLKADYVQRMIGFTDTEYYWGGENARGIDCSGLPRRALRDALLAYGVQHGNGQAFRAAVDQWWFDTSAKAMSEGYRNYTKPLGISGTIHTLHYSALAAGDLAVTTDGVHVMIYLGNEEWIQADPTAQKVVIENGRSAQNAWFNVPVTVHRWGVLG